MHNINIQKKPNYVIHLIYACSFLFAVLAVIGYLIWDKHQVAIQRQVEIEQHIAQKKQEIEDKVNQKRIENDQRLIQEKERKSKIINCMFEASKTYNSEWAVACKEQANKIKIDLDNCINEAASFVEYMKMSWTEESESRKLYNLKASQCRSLYIPNPKSNCTLPASVAQGLNKGYEEYKKLCNEMI